MMSKIISVGGGDVATVNIGGAGPLVFLGGPCAIESRDHALEPNMRTPSLSVLERKRREVRVRVMVMEEEEEYLQLK